MARQSNKAIGMASLFVLLTLSPAAHATRSALKHERVRKAAAAKGELLKAAYRDAGLAYPARRIFLRIFKKENLIELWGEKKDGTYKKIKNYPVCYASGKLGPKRWEGDQQVPEGFYHISVFNPRSSYHLSLGINYPNRSDRKLGKRSRLGGQIMIHGDCVSIGCVAITNDLIKEVYVLAAQARSKGQRRIPVHIFPTRLDDEGMQRLSETYKGRQALLAFWRSLKLGYDYFDRHHKPPQMRVRKDGLYRLR
jgi:murein L,D-transpeptidase YafK